MAPKGALPAPSPQSPHPGTMPSGWGTPGWGLNLCLVSHIKHRRWNKGHGHTANKQLTALSPSATSSSP